MARVLSKEIKIYILKMCRFTRRRLNLRKTEIYEQKITIM